MDKKIYFCFPYKKVGGVSIVFLRLSKELSRQGFDCYLIDYIDGYMSKHIDSNVNFLEYHDNRLTNIPSNSIVVFQSMTPWSIFPNLKINPNANVVFWNCHPFNLVPTMPGIRSIMMKNHLFGKFILNAFLRGYKRKIIRFISNLSKNKALFFMDKTNLVTTEKYLDISINSPTFLPIPLKKKSIEIPYKNNKPQNEYKIAWIGRMVDFKFNILKRALNDLDYLSDSNKKIKIEIVIIGNGPKKKNLDLHIKKLKNISIELIDYISPGEIENFLLLNEIDILMAMGTSALEGARLGIPTILLDIAYNEVRDGYNYQWINERDGFTLGDVINQNHYSDKKNLLKIKLDEYEKDKVNLSIKVNNYFNLNHSIESVSSRFIELILESRCTWKNLQTLRVVNRGFFYNLFTKLRGIYKSS